MTSRSCLSAATVITAAGLLAAPAETIVFTPLTGSIDNPERGFYTVGPGNGNLADLSADYNSLRAQGATLTYGRLNLEDYAATEIPESFLENVEINLGRIRDAGLKTIIRITYNNGLQTPNPPVEATLAQTRVHLEQLQPILEAHKDVILVFQAGIIGAWGEWNSTDVYRDPLIPYEDGNVPSVDNRRAVIDALLDFIPAERFVQVRRPWFKDPAFGAEAFYPGQQLDGTTAFTGIPLARIGHHNDCFLASATDFGTYQPGTIEEQKDFLASDTRFTPMGGETCNPDIVFANCTRAIEEMERFHWTYLNIGYHPDVLQEFRDSGCYDEIEQRLGYRFELLSADLPATITNDSAEPFSITLRNVGFAAPFNERPVHLLILSGSEVVAEIPITDADPRRWLPGVEHAIQGTFSVSGVVAPATLSAALWLPDPSATIRSRPDYAIRFANENVWQPTTGYNVLSNGIELVPTASLSETISVH